MANPFLRRFPAAVAAMLPRSISPLAVLGGKNVHVAFPADENETVDGFHATLVEAGYRDDGPPGERPIYHRGYYGAYVLDPDGNSIEIVSHNR